MDSGPQKLKCTSLGRWASLSIVTNAWVITHAYMGKFRERARTGLSPEMLYQIVFYSQLSNTIYI